MDIKIRTDVVRCGWKLSITVNCNVDLSTGPSSKKMSVVTVIFCPFVNEDFERSLTMDSTWSCRKRKKGDNSRQITINNQSLCSFVCLLVIKKRLNLGTRPTVFLWHTNLHGLCNAKSIHIEEQKWFYFTHS